MSEVILDDKLKQPEFKGMVDHGAIGVFDNFVKWEFCDSVVDSFEYWYKRKHIEKEDLDVNVTTYNGREIKLNPMSEGGKQFTQGSLGRKDDQLYLEISDPAMAMEINQIVGGCFELYAKKYKGILDSCDPVSSWTCKIQRTNSGGGYHIWHSENGSFLYRDRVLTWMIYLNDIPFENGGATDFFHQEISFQPKKGTVVLWPAAYTHVHRGAFLTGDVSKYIATGWFSREPGDVTNRILGEKSGRILPREMLNG
mgnify:FL=1|tara:strand:- start:355 stop:1116 length:762 start_codon:yes stop_codon:yes gene_type:complete